MEYADLILVTVVLVYPLSIPLLAAAGTSADEAIALGSALAAGIILHALFVNPPG